MKTHSARWYQNSPTSWVLKEPSRDGGAVLATIQDDTHGASAGYLWRLEPHTSIWWEWRASRYAAQRAARKALRECKQ